MKKPYTKIVQMIIEAKTQEDLDEVGREIEREYIRGSKSALKGVYLQAYDVIQLDELVKKVRAAV